MEMGGRREGMPGSNNRAARGKWASVCVYECMCVGAETETDSGGLLSPQVLAIGHRNRSKCYCFSNWPMGFRL